MFLSPGCMVSVGAQVSENHLVRPKGNRVIQVEGSQETHMGMSENSVPLHPMVNDHYPY